MSHDILFCLKENAQTKESRIAFLDICSVYGAETGMLSDVFFHIDTEASDVTALDAAKALKDVFPSHAVINMGPPKCTVVHIRPYHSKTIMAIKIIVLCVVMFFGGAVAIMTFHEDVSMRKVHSDIYAFFTGQETDRVDAVSIPYSIGIAVGLIMIFGLFKRHKKRPTVLDLDIFKHEQALRQYMSENSNNDSG